MTWQPIETAPKDGRWVLLCTITEDGDYNCYPEAFRYEKGEWYSAIDGSAITTKFTHWMPLPEPPK